MAPHRMFVHPCVFSVRFTSERVPRSAPTDAAVTAPFITICSAMITATVAHRIQRSIDRNDQSDSPRQMKTVIINGKLVMRDHKLLTVDEQSAIAKAREYKNKIAVSLGMH